MENVKPKKQLGQHFLKDQNIARKIVGLLEVEKGGPVIEIGPGTGILTKLLLEKDLNVTAVEFDRESVAYLEAHFPPALTVLNEDFLKWDLATNLPGPAAFIGNLPYNISSPIFFHLLDHRDLFDSGVFMVQKEVAERICAPHGSKTYGILSVLLQAFYELRYEFTVSEKVFHPRPKVLSGVFSAKRRESAPEVVYEQLKKLVKAAFQQRRKTLRNSLKAFEFQDIPELAEILTLRPEAISVEGFITLTKWLK